MTGHGRGRHGRLGEAGTPRIAVDLLGGDDAPAVVVDGAQRACSADPDVHLLLVGPAAVAEKVVAAVDPAERHRLSILPVDRGVGMSEPAARGADSSTTIGAALRALADGRVDAVVSAGASGATVAAAVVACGRLPGVRRPALAAILPALRGLLVLLDVGAGTHADPVDLVSHADLGAAYARIVVGVARPRVGLLSVGSESGKGDQLRIAADAALRRHRLVDASYVGPVEGDEVVTAARADVVVTDGFSGNVVLKGVEAALGASPAAPPPASLPRAAALLGVAGAVVVCHGIARGEEIASGISLAARLVRDDVIARLTSAAKDHTAASLAEVPT